MRIAAIRKRAASSVNGGQSRSAIFAATKEELHSRQKRAIGPHATGEAVDSVDMADSVAAVVAVAAVEAVNSVGAIEAVDAVETVEAVEATGVTDMVCGGFIGNDQRDSLRVRSCARHCVAAAIH
jgi:hypothetical protein